MKRTKNKRLARTTTPVLAFIALIVLGALAGAFFLWPKSSENPEDIKKRPPAATLSAEQVEKIVRAIALLENNDFDPAIELFEKLLLSNPGNGPLSRNLAIARLSKVEFMIGIIQDPEKAELRTKYIAELPDAIEKAEESAAAAVEAQPEDGAVYQIATAVARLRILRTPAIAEQLRFELVDRIRKYFERSPGNPSLANAFYETADELSVSNPELKKESIQPLFDAWKKMPRNLFLMYILASQLIESEDDRIIDVMQQANAAAEPFVEYISQTLNTKDSRVFLSQAIEAYRNGDKEDSRLAFTQWMNCLKGCPAFKPDERLLKPSTLALIDIRDIESAIRNLSAKRSTSTTPSEPWKHTKHTLLKADSASSIILAKWFDWDLDFVPEVLTVDSAKLELRSWDPSANQLGSAIATVALTGKYDRCELIDLFEVQFPKRTVVKQADREMVVKNRMPDIAESELIPILDARQSVYRDIVLFGEEGVAFITTKDDFKSTDPRSLVLLSDKTGLEDLKNVTHLIPNDWDGDGDLDLFMVAEGKPTFRLNLGNRTFIDTTAYSEFPKDLPAIVSVTACDFDRDVDADFVVGLDGGPGIGVFENLLHGQFRFRTLEDRWTVLAKSNCLDPVELDGNVSWDFLGSNENGIHSVRTVTPEIGKISATSTQTIDSQAKSFASADLNNDTWTDLLALTNTGLQLYLGREGGDFSKEPIRLNAELEARSLSLGDSNQDGFLDVLALDADGLSIYVGNATDKAAYTTLRLRCIADTNGGGRINEYGIGSVVELYSPGRYQAAIVKDEATHFGLADSGPAYNARIIFTNGLTQNSIEPKLNSVVEEKQLPKGSCPFLYAWNGHEMAFVTDLLWNAPLGLQVAPGKTIPDRRWEYLHIPHRFLQARDGGFDLRVTEELWEAAYFDQIELTAIDHPADTLVLTNEKVGPPNIAQPKIWEFQQAMPVKSVVDQSGRHWQDELSTIDQRYAIPFEKRHCQGLVESHYLEIDLGDIAAWNSIQLVLHGWIFPTDTSLNIALSQNPDIEGPQPPSLWIPDAQGNFVCVQPMMGFPGGKPKSIVVDLTGLFQNRDYRVRVQTSNEIYWDQVLVASETPNPRTVATPCPLESAELRYRGFSQVVMTTRDQAHWFDYSKTGVAAQWLPMEGFFTRFGDVQSLLMHDDDRMVVMGSGDEMVLRFQEPSSSVPEGWVRDFVMHNVGWDKDADLNTLEGQSSLPLPFGKQQGYPAPSSQWKEVQRVWELNRDQLTRQQSLQSFWNRTPKNVNH